MELHNIRRFKKILQDKDLPYSSKIYENVIDIKDFKTEFLEKWDEVKPSGLKSLNKFLKNLDSIKKYQINVNAYRMNQAMISLGDRTMAEFIAHTYPKIFVYLDDDDFLYLTNPKIALKNNIIIKDKILILIGHELLHVIQWKKGAWISPNNLNTDEFQKLFNKYSKELELKPDSKFNLNIHGNEEEQEEWVYHLLQKSNDYELMAWAWTIIEKLMNFYKDDRNMVANFIQLKKITELENKIENYKTLKLIFSKWPEDLEKKRYKFLNYCYNYLNSSNGEISKANGYKDYIKKLDQTKYHLNKD